MDELIKNLQEAVDKLHSTFDRTDLDVECRKIQQKMEEARYNPGDAKPFADSIFSLLLAAKNGGFNVDAIFSELERVAERMKQKRWKKMEDGTYKSL